MSQQIKIQLPPLHSAQWEVAKHPARFKVLAAGRRFGKTRLATLLCLTEALQGGRVWWVAPTYSLASIGWRALRELTRQIPGTDIRESDRLITVPGGGTVQAKSADNVDSLRGEGLDFVALDEAAFMSEAAWTEALRPALADRQGKAIFISTPRGRNWFHWLFLYAQDQENADWAAWRFPSGANPYLDPQEIEAARQTMPEKAFLQEIEAQFLEDAGLLFRKVREAATAQPQSSAQPGHEYVIGCDWGRTGDFTVFCVFDVTGQSLVCMDRFTEIEYQIQVNRLQALYERFCPRAIIAEANSMGAPITEALQRQGLPVQAFTTTNTSKVQIIDALVLAFEQGTIRILDDPVLIGELEAYESERLPSGLLRYSAPPGIHDDTVIALALAYSGAERSKPPLIVDNPLFDGGGLIDTNREPLEVLRTKHDPRSKLHRRWAMRNYCPECARERAELV